MSLSRRFLNLIVKESVPGVRSLRCLDLDLTRNELFSPPPGTPPPPWMSSNMVDQIQLPSPTLSLASGVSCMPLSDRKVLCTDRSGDTSLFDADTRSVVTMPTVHKPKWKPVSIFVPGSGGGDADPDPAGSLFLMERRPKQEGARAGPQSDQFEAFVYRRSSKASPSKSWHHKLLPPLPYLRDLGYRSIRSEITSYAVVGGGSHVCISMGGYSTSTDTKKAAGTYYLDTARHTWSKAFKWTLPFRGKVEYVPELKLWFGILRLRSSTPVLGAADLSTMDSEPSLVGAWDLELDDWLESRRVAWDLELGETIKEWPPELQEAHLVHLGSGRFCVASSLHTRRIIRTCLGNELSFKRLSVFTGVELTPRVHGFGELQMVNKHKLSRCSALVDSKWSTSISCSSEDGDGLGELEMVRCNSKWLSDGTSIDAAF